MGYGGRKRRVREAIASWDCFGRFGYGQGRVVAQYGDTYLAGKSVCESICTRGKECRRAHHARMDVRYPQLSQIVMRAVGTARAKSLDIVTEVVGDMERALALGVPEAQEIRQVLDRFSVKSMTDHYRAGQFVNLEAGLRRVKIGNDERAKLPS